MARRKSERRIFFPWERRGGWLRRIGLHRAQPFLALVAALVLVVTFSVRDRRKAGERRTRASLHALRHAVDLFLADHEGQCPGSFDELSNYGALQGTPRDAWGKPFTLTCPDPSGQQAYRLQSGGADGIIGGFDRVE